MVFGDIQAYIFTTAKDTEIKCWEKYMFSNPIYQNIDLIHTYIYISTCGIKPF